MVMNFWQLSKTKASFTSRYLNWTEVIARFFWTIYSSVKFGQCGANAPLCFRRTIIATVMSTRQMTVGVHDAKGTASVTAGWRPPSFRWFGCGRAGTSCDDWCLRPKDRSSCRTATGSSPTPRFRFPLGGPYMGRKEWSPLRRHCASHFPAWHTARSFPPR